MTQPDDGALLEQIAQGDRGAFRVFVGRHQAPAFRYLRAAGGDDADAEDALQETFLSVWKHAGTYRGGASARGWVLTVGRNALRKARRLRAGEPADYESVESLGLRSGWGAEAGALDALVKKDLLEQALGALTAQDREVLVLRELEGFSGEEVAEMLDVSLPAMKSRLHRARLRFVAALEEVGGG